MISMESGLLESSPSFTTSSTTYRPATSGMNWGSTKLPLINAAELLVGLSMRLQV